MNYTFFFLSPRRERKINPPLPLGGELEKKKSLCTATSPLMFDVEVNYRRTDVGGAAALRGVFLLFKAQALFFFHPQTTQNAVCPQGVSSSSVQNGLKKLKKLSDLSSASEQPFTPPRSAEEFV